MAVHGRGAVFAMSALGLRQMRVSISTRGAEVVSGQASRPPRYNRPKSGTSKRPFTSLRRRKPLLPLYLAVPVRDHSTRGRAILPSWAPHSRPVEIRTSTRRPRAEAQRVGLGRLRADQLAETFDHQHHSNSSPRRAWPASPTTWRFGRPSPVAWSLPLARTSYGVVDNLSSHHGVPSPRSVRRPRRLRARNADGRLVPQVLRTAPERRCGSHLRGRRSRGYLGFTAQDRPGMP